MKQQPQYDLIVLGGGAAGLMAALTAGQSGCRVLVLEASNKIGKKILMSGGGRCNFTNLEVEAGHFLSDNPHFVKSALKQYTNWDFISLVATYGIEYHEKDHGQLFCDHSAKDILAMLLAECKKVDVDILTKSEVFHVEHDQSAEQTFNVQTTQGQFKANNLVVATGGISIPSLGGATGFGYKLAEQFDLKIHKTEASLVPMTLAGKWHDFSAALSGVSIPVVAEVESKGFVESLLFTHRGLSGPAILQLSNYWHLGEPVTIDLLPSVDLNDALKQAKGRTPKLTINSVLKGHLPKSLIEAMQKLWWKDEPLQNFKYTDLETIAAKINAWQLTPSGTEGYRTAEVTRGGVDVSQISSKTMKVNGINGLYFIGEVLDVTGHLGGFNFQWAWSSGYVAGKSVASNTAAESTNS